LKVLNHYPIYITAIMGFTMNFTFSYFFFIVVYLEINKDRPYFSKNNTMQHREQSAIIY
jgi:hypothetical protein